MMWFGVIEMVWCTPQCALWVAVGSRAAWKGVVGTLVNVVTVPEVAGVSS